MEELLNDAYKVKEIFEKRSSCVNVHIAIVYKGKNKIQYIGVNKHNATYKNPLYCLLTIHAEMDAINGFLRGYNPTKAKGIKRQNLKLFVIRFTKSGLLANSEPCIDCVQKMYDLGIKRVSWTTSERTIESNTPKNLLLKNNSTVSSGNRENILNKIKCDN